MGTDDKLIITPYSNYKPKLCIGVPCTDVFYKAYVISLARTLTKLADSYNFDVALVSSCYVHCNRNWLFGYAQEHDVDYLLMTDSDSVWHPDDVEKLINLRKPVCSGWYLSRHSIDGKTHVPILLKRVGNKYGLIHKIPNTPFTCDVVGAGFMLVTKEVIEKMNKLGFPFDMIKGSDVDIITTGPSGLLGEDVSFCYRLQQEGYKIWVDPTVKIGHASVEIIRGNVKAIRGEN